MQVWASKQSNETPECRSEWSLLREMPCPVMNKWPLKR